MNEPSLLESDTGQSAVPFGEDFWSIVVVDIGFREGVLQACSGDIYLGDSQYVVDLE